MSGNKEGDNRSPSSHTGSHISSTVRPTAKYNPLSDSLRQMTSGGLSCSMFCGGKSCKYESGTYWSEDQMAINGLYSSWVTDGILAMARPNTENIVKYDIIDQFKKQGIKSIVNLQRPGEHSSCGKSLESDEFSYLPQTFMDNDIFFYNFGWDDYGVRSLTSILDMVKVMSFALTQGKVGVHCHAGLGRTGVLIACYLVYDRRMDGDHAIHYVREKRPGAIQTKGQIECVTAFAQFLIPLRVVFSSCDPSAYPFTLDQYLNRQRLMLHGYEARELKHIPKVVKIICRRLQELAKCMEPNSSDQSADLEIMKKTAPGAFQSRRNQAQGDDSSVTSSCASLASRSSSQEENNSSDPSLATHNHATPKQPNPHVDLRDRMQRHKIHEESNSDEETTKQTTPRLAQSTDFSHSKSVHGQVTRMPMHRLSSSSLVHHGNSGGSFDEIDMVARAMIFDLGMDDGDDVDNPGGVVQSLKARVASLQQNLNVSDSAWHIVMTEEDPFVLCLLMWSWLEHLSVPVLSMVDAGKLISVDDDPVIAFKSLPKGPKYTLECILKLVAYLQPLSPETEDSILYRVMQAVCHITRDQLNDSDKTPRQDLNGSQSDNDDDDESFSTPQFLVFLRQYLFHLRLRIPSVVSSTKPQKSTSHLGASSDEAQLESSKTSPAPTRKHSDGNKQGIGKGKNGRNKLRKDSGKEVVEKDDMPIPIHRNNALPPIF